MKQGVTQMMDGMIQTLTESKNYRVAQRIRLAQGLTPLVPELLKQLPPDYRQGVPGRLKKILDAEPDPDLKKAIQDLHDAAKPA